MPGRQLLYEAMGARMRGIVDQKRLELAERMRKVVKTEGVQVTQVPGLILVRRCCSTVPHVVTYEPSLALVVQGKKRVTLGGRSFVWGGSSFLLTSLDLPVLSQVVRASEREPYLCFLLKLDLSLVREVMASCEVLPKGTDQPGPAMVLGKVTPELLDACCRLVGLLERPEEISFLANLIQREIIFRILQTSAGARLREIVLLGSQSHRLARTVHWLRENYSKPVRIPDLARMCGMATSTFHHHFRSLMGMSPLQYVKKLRLMAARQRMLADGLDVTSAAFEVGYQSPSQFSRDYKRLFGRPPKTDVLSALRSVRQVA